MPDGRDVNVFEVVDVESVEPLLDMDTRCSKDALRPELVAVVAAD